MSHDSLACGTAKSERSGRVTLLRQRLRWIGAPPRVPPWGSATTITGVSPIPHPGCRSHWRRRSDGMAPPGPARSSDGIARADVVHRADSMPQGAAHTIVVPVPDRVPVDLGADAIAVADGARLTGLRGDRPQVPLFEREARVEQITRRTPEPRDQLRCRLARVSGDRRSCVNVETNPAECLHRRSERGRGRRERIAAGERAQTPHRRTGAHSPRQLVALVVSSSRRYSERRSMPSTRAACVLLPPTLLSTCRT